MRNNPEYMAQKRQLEESGLKGPSLQEAKFNLWWLYLQHYNKSGVL